MVRDFATLQAIPLRRTTTFTRTSEPPELVSLDSPAESVMTNFRRVYPVTTGPSARIDQALQKMKSAGVRLLFVVDPQKIVLGLITATDIMGERPINVAHETRVPRTEITVEMVMTPQPDVVALSVSSVHNAKVGHIVETLRELQCQHTLVVDVDAATQTQEVVGMFSTTQLARSLGMDIRADVTSANTLAELIHHLG